MSLTTTLRTFLVLALLSGCGGEDPTLSSAEDEASARPTAKVYILIGQSNMLGLASANGLASSLTNQPGVWIHANGGWQPLRSGLGYQAPGYVNTFGPELSFGLRHDGRTPASVVPGLIKFAIDGTNLDQQWRAGTGPLYQQLIARVRNATNAIRGTYDVEIAGVAWMQGESDALSSGRASRYEANLRSFISRLRSDLSGLAAQGYFRVSSRVPFAVGRISSSPLWTYRNTVRHAQVWTSMTTLDVGLVDTDDLARLGDNAHYNRSSTVTLGYRFFDALNGSPVPAGLFRFGAYLYYSNGSHYCYFDSMARFTRITGRTNADGIPYRRAVSRRTVYDGVCQG